jgi:hypothetical protein
LLLFYLLPFGPPQGSGGVKKAPLTAKQLNDSATADHACFADSTDVFGIIRLSEVALWQA